MLDPYSQMPPMTAQTGIMGMQMPGSQPAAQQQPGAVPNPQTLPGGAAPQAQTAQSAGANPMPPQVGMPNPSSMAPGQPGSTQQGPPAPGMAPAAKPAMSMNMMGQPGSPAPSSSATPGTTPAIPTPQAATPHPIGIGAGGGKGSVVNNTPQKGVTPTGQKTGSLNDIAMQIMSEGMMGGGNSMMGGMM